MQGIKLPELKDIEDIILGTIMLYRQNRDEICETLSVEDFYDILNQKIFTKIKNAPADFTEMDIKDDFVTISQLSVVINKSRTFLLSGPRSIRSPTPTSTSCPNLKLALSSALSSKSYSPCIS